MDFSTRIEFSNDAAARYSEQAGGEPSNTISKGFVGGFCDKKDL
jgi:hypothetical protein